MAKIDLHSGNKIITGRVLKTNLKLAGAQLVANGFVVIGVGPDPDPLYWRVTWTQKRATA